MATAAAAPEATVAAPPHAALTFGGWAAGYLTTAPAGQRYTSVSARFRLPKDGPVAHTTPGAWVSIWAGVGLRAERGGQLMQAGISMRAGVAGWDRSAPWWINEPATPTAPHDLDLVVSPGDKVEVDVREVDRAAHNWVFTVRDLSAPGSASGWCYGCVSDGQTAGWLVEDPMSGALPADFADPGRVDFLAASAGTDGGAPVLLPQQDWHPVLRTVYGQAPGGAVPLAALAPTASRQGPLGAAPDAVGAFSVGDLPPAPAREGARS